MSLIGMCVEQLVCWGRLWKLQEVDSSWRRQVGAAQRWQFYLVQFLPSFPVGQKVNSQPCSSHNAVQRYPNCGLWAQISQTVSQSRSSMTLVAFSGV